jgi:cytochrome b involved in lipid metabolism
MSDDRRVFTRASLVEFAQQNKSKTYVSIHENVFEVSQFLDEHPGGKEVLLDYRILNEFRDATEAFEDNGHSLDARDLMKKFQVGSLDTKKDTKSTKQQDEQNEVIPETDDEPSSGYSLLS